MVGQCEGCYQRGRRKGKWLDRMRDDIRQKWLSGQELYDEATLSIYRPRTRVGLSSRGRRRKHSHRWLVALTCVAEEFCERIAPPKEVLEHILGVSECEVVEVWGASEVVRPTSTQPLLPIPVVHRTFVFCQQETIGV